MVECGGVGRFWVGGGGGAGGSRIIGNPWNSLDLHGFMIQLYFVCLGPQTKFERAHLNSNIVFVVTLVGRNVRHGKQP